MPYLANIHRLVGWMNEYVHQELSAGCPEHFMDLAPHAGPEENFSAVGTTEKMSQTSSQIPIHNPRGICILTVTCGLRSSGRLYNRYTVLIRACELY